MKIIDSVKRKVVIHKPSANSKNKSKDSFRGGITFGKKHLSALGIDENTKNRDVNVVIADDLIIISRNEITQEKLDELEKTLMPDKILEQVREKIEEITEIIQK